MSEEIVITISLKPTRWQRLLDRLKIKKFKYDENMIAIKGEHCLYDRPNSKIKIIKVQENPLNQYCGLKPKEDD